MSPLDNQIRETVNRLLDSMRGRLESDLSSCQDELIEAARIAAEAAEGATAEARREAEEARADLQAQLDQARCEAQAAHDALEGIKRDLESARAELDATRDDVEATLQDIETARRDSDAARLEVGRLTDALRNQDDRAAQVCRLPEAVRALDEAASFGEVLENLAVRAGREAGRAAVFLVKENRLRDWRTVGFDFASDAARLDINLDDSGPMAEAVQSGQGVGPRNGNGIPEFARTDDAREAAAWPVSVGGSVVAVLYADGPVADKSEESYWPAFLEVLARHAGRVLEGITVRQAAGLMTGTATRMSSVISRSSGSIQ